MATKDYDETVAHIAGNLLSGASVLWVNADNYQREQAARMAVMLARSIVRATQESEPEETR
jgi:hypothetical protein